MAHIELQNDFPGIRGLFQYRPETAQPLLALAEALLRNPSTLSRGDRELIATRVSHLNGCKYCTRSHAAFAAAYFDGNNDFVQKVITEPDSAPIDAKLKALLVIAGRVQASGKHVKPEDIAIAKAAGATEVEIHDTVLIAAAFCMYNRYVDGLATNAPDEMDVYHTNAKGIVAEGYMRIPKK